MFIGNIINFLSRSDQHMSQKQKQNKLSTYPILMNLGNISNMFVLLYLRNFIETRKKNEKIMIQVICL